MNNFESLILSTPVVNGKCVLTVWNSKAGYVNASDVREVAASGAITILSESGPDSLSADYGRTSFAFIKN